jgi:glutamate formiminotransferase
VTPPAVAYAAVRDEAARYGVAIDHPELIGLIPRAAVGEGGDWLPLDFNRDRILENRIARVMGVMIYFDAGPGQSET